MLLSHGFSDFISKPVDLSRLHAVLVAWLPKGKQVAAVAGPHPQAEGAARRAPSPPLEAEGVDARAGLRNVGGSLENYKRALRAFLEDAAEKRAQLPAALAGGDLRAYAVGVHGLKSASAYIGARGLSGAAGELEAAAGRGDAAYLAAHSGEFMDALGRLCGGVSAFVGAAAAPPGPGAPPAELRGELLSLREALHSYDVGAADALLRGLEGTMESALAERVARLVLVSDFEAASAEVDARLEGPGGG